MKFKLKNTIEGSLLINLHKVEHYIFKHRCRGVRKIFSPFCSILNHLIVQIGFNCVIPKEVVIGNNFCIPHPFCIVMTPLLKIGNNVKIMQQVTIGFNELSSVPFEGISIGDNVYIGAGAQIIGNDIKIGNNAKIGANAVVLRDVPDGATAVGIPAKIIIKK